MSTVDDPAAALSAASERALSGGPPRHHAKSAEQGKLPVRERIALLLDVGSFTEDGLLSHWDLDGEGADGVVTGVGTLDGRPVAVIAIRSTCPAKWEWVDVDGFPRATGSLRRR